MNGYPIVVFVEGEYLCVVLCATTDIAHAWKRGAAFAVSAFRGPPAYPSDGGFSAVSLGHRRAFASRAIAEVELDDVLHDEDIAIDSAERRKAVDALERAKSVAFPHVITIVK